MTMHKVRIKTLKKKRLSNERYCSRKHRSRIERAISSLTTLKQHSDSDRELIIQRACLRAEIVKLTIARNESNTSVLIANKLKQIDRINRKLTHS